jgi:hypothetical protein
MCNGITPLRSLSEWYPRTHCRMKSCTVAVLDHRLTSANVTEGALAEF